WPEVRDELEQIDDAEIEATLAHIPVTTAQPGNSVQATSAEGRDPYGSRFRVLRKYARGGIGVVSVALDRELNREVAIKEIHAEHADSPESQSRFLREAEVTGRLEHPGIVPVYSLGFDARGRPFYAMRLVRGHSLKEAIDRFHREDTDTARDP